MLYTEFDNILMTLSDRAANAAESHGSLIGLFSTKPETAVEEWLATLAEDAGSDADALSRELGDSARALTAKLSAGDMGFQLLLPDDDTTLPERVTALAHWCQGYLYGLAQGGIQQFKGLPGDCTEILEDFVTMTQVRGDDESEGSERDFFELTEYVRIGAQLVFEELTEVTNAMPKANQPAH